MPGPEQGGGTSLNEPGYSVYLKDGWIENPKGEPIAKSAAQASRGLRQTSILTGSPRA
jgi:hypothetical protein